MILEQEELIEEISLGGVEEDVIEAGIDMSNISFILDLVSTKFYSDPIGSIVREIASNSVDANTESGSEKPIIIKMGVDTENRDAYFIEFIDNGLGITTERFDKVYRKWFSSTKRLTNNQIGSFGLGSKSILAYSQYFFITTRCEGYETKYILSKNNGTVPKIEILSKVECSGATGTTIRIDIRNATDFNKFEYAIKDQLQYFSNVYVDSFTRNINNEYKIYDCNHFQYRSGNTEGKMHLLLGKVKYKIDEYIINSGLSTWDKGYIKIPNIPVGLKFEIGEIMVNPNRESIEYKTKTIELIKEKINLVVEELKLIFSKQNPVINDLGEFIVRRKETPVIKFSEEHKLDVESLGVENSVIFEPLKGVILPNNLFEEYFTEIIRNSTLKNRKNKYTLRVTEKSDISTLTRSYLGNKSLNRYSNSIIGEGLVILYDKQRYDQILSDLKLNPRVGYSTNWYKKVAANQNHNVRVPRLGSAQIVYKFRKIVREYLERTCREYPTATEEYIKEYKRARLDNQASKRRKENKLVICYDSIGKNREEIALDTLRKSVVVFYSIKDEARGMGQLEKYENLILYGHKDKKTLYFLQGKGVSHLPRYRFISITKTNFNQFKNLDNLQHISSFFRTPSLQVEFNKMVLASLWNTNDTCYTDTSLYYELKIVSDYYANLASKLRMFLNQYDIEYINRNLEDLKKIPVRNHYRTLNIRKTKKELDAFLPKTQLLSYLTGKIPVEVLKKIIKNFKEIKTIKLNKELWQTKSVSNNMEQLSSLQLME